MSDLYTETMRLLDERQKSLRVIAQESGLKYDWLSQLSQRRITDPGVRKIHRLHEYLTREDEDAAA